MRIEWVAVGLLMASIEGCGGNAVVPNGGAGGSHPGAAGAGGKPDAGAADGGGAAEAGSLSTVEDGGNYACGNIFCAATEVCAVFVTCLAGGAPATFRYYCYPPDSGAFCISGSGTGADPCLLDCV